MRWLLLTLLLVSCAEVAAGTYIGVGRAAIIGGNYQGAQQIATASARRAAARKALDSYAEAQAIDAQRYALARPGLLAGPLSFISAEEVTGTQEQEGLMMLQLRITVDETALARFFDDNNLESKRRVEARKASRPAVMVLIAEELNGAGNPQPVSSRVVQEALIEGGYRVVDQAAVERVIAHDQAVQASFNPGSQASLQAAALQFNAGLLVSGSALAQASGIRAGSMQAFAAAVELRVLAADSGKILASATGEGNYPHVNALQGARLAIEEAAQAAAARLLKKLDDLNIDTGSELLFNVAGVNFEQLALLKQLLLRDFDSVEAIDTLGFAGDLGRLRLRIRGSATAFAEQLALKDFGAFDLRVLSAAPGKMDVKLELPD